MCAGIKNKEVEYMRKLLQERGLSPADTHRVSPLHINYSRSSAQGSFTISLKQLEHMGLIECNPRWQVDAATTRKKYLVA